MASFWTSTIMSITIIKVSEKNWLPRKRLLLNVYFKDQNPYGPDFSVFLLEPYNML